MNRQPDIAAVRRPEGVHNLEFARILTPYVFSLPVAMGKRVLDVGCGSGCGAWLMIANGAERVGAIDLDPAKVRQAASLCASFHNIHVSVADAQAIPFEDDSFEVVTCFEVIEHVREPDALLGELRRVLRGAGVLLLTTPNRAVRLLPMQRPWNREHLREYGSATLQRRLLKHLPFLALLGIRGERPAHEYYRRIWRPSLGRLLRSCLLRLARPLVPPRLRHWVRRHRRSQMQPGLSSLLDMPIPPARPANWPFYVSKPSEHCLGLFAVSGFHRHIVREAAEDLEQLAQS